MAAGSGGDPMVPGTRRPMAGASRAALVKRRWENAPCRAARENRRGARSRGFTAARAPKAMPATNSPPTRATARVVSQGLQDDCRSEGDARQEGPANAEMVDEPEDVVDEVVVGDPSQRGAVAGLISGIVVLDRAESSGQAVQHQRVRPI